MSRRNTKRCGSCHHTWDPKGKTQNSNCPNCNSTDTRFVIDNPNAAPKKEAPPTPPVAPPVFGSWEDNAPQYKKPSHAAQLGGTASQSAARSASQKGRAAPPKATPKKGAMGFGLLFLIVVGVLGALIWVRTDGKLFGLLAPPIERTAPQGRKATVTTKSCQTILRRYRHAARMEQRSSRKWKKWRKHWQEKAEDKGCALPAARP